MSQRRKPQEESGIVEQYKKVDHFLDENKNLVIGIGIGFVLIVAGLLYFNRMYLPEQEKLAQEAIFQAQLYFENDSLGLALNGDAINLGFIDISNEYSLTSAGNLSDYYAGICFLKQGKFDDAIDYLSSFSSDDQVISTLALSALGDAYMEKGNTDKGISFYKKAAKNNRNEFTTPIMLLKTGQALESVRKYADAKKYYEKLKSEYPLSQEGAEIDKYIARVVLKM